MMNQFLESIATDAFNDELQKIAQSGEVYVSNKKPMGVGGVATGVALGIGGAKAFGHYGSKYGPRAIGMAGAVKNSIQTQGFKATMSNIGKKALSVAGKLKR